MSGSLLSISRFRVFIVSLGLLTAVSSVTASPTGISTPFVTPAPVSLISPDLPVWVQTPLAVDPAASRLNSGGVPSSPTRITLLETQIDVASRSEFNHYAYRVETEAGLQNAGQITIDFAPAYQTLQWHSLRIWRDGRPRDVLAPSLIQVLRQEENADRFLYHGRMTALALLNDVRVGDIVELAYTRTGFNPVFGDHFSTTLPGSSSTPIDRLYYRITEAPGRPLQIATLGDFKPIQETVSQGGRTEHSWSGRNIAAVSALADVPPSECQYAYVQITDFTSWKDVRAWARSLFAQQSIQHQDVFDRIQPLLDACKSTDEKTDAIIRFVQDDIRYLGLHFNESTHRPATPMDVLERRFGDCKDKSLLLVTLLRGIGLEADVALVNSTWQRGLAGMLPSPLSFDHAIVRVRRPEAPTFSGALSDPSQLPREFPGVTTLLTANNYPEPAKISMRISDRPSHDYLWLDPTISLQGGPWERRHIPDYGYALALIESEEDLTRVTSPLAAEGVINVREIYTVSDYTSPVKLELTTVYHGASADAYRYFSRVADSVRYTQQLTGYLARFYPKITAVSPISWEDNREANILTARSEYQIADFWLTDTEKRYRTIEVFPWALSDRLPRPETINRLFPFALPHEQTYSQNTTLFLPKEWPDSSDHTEINDDSFVFVYSTKTSGKRVDLSYQWRSLADSVAPQGLDEWNRKMAEVRATFGYKLQQNIRLAVAVKKQGPIWSLVAAGIAGLSAGAVIGWLFYRWQPLPRRRPPDSDHLEGIGGWLIILALGVVIRPIAQLISAKETFALMADHVSWVTLTDKESLSYISLFAVISWCETFIQGLLFTWSLVMCVQFFKRKPSLPAALSCLLITLMVWQIAQQIIASTIIPTAKDAVEAWPKVIGRTIGVALWVWYLQVSRRVKVTFRQKRSRLSVTPPAV